MAANQPEWKEMKSKIKAKFGKLSDTEIEGLHGHMDRLQNTVKKAYGYADSKAEQECKAFNASIGKKP